MIILYISSLSPNIASGLSWSVPAGVDAQSRIDDVLWINTTETFIEHWGEVNAFHNCSEYGKLELNSFPSPFNHPDLVVFEGYNYIEHALFARRLRRKSIPYIIIPRGALTREAQNNHAKWKKRIANLLFLNCYIKKCASIQFLTTGEMQNSIGYNKHTHFVLPNGFNDPQVHKTTFSDHAIRATFIGRLDMHHKGLDLLLNVLELQKDNLERKNFHLSIYGPKRYDYYKIQDTIRAKRLEKVASIIDEVSGSKKQKVLLESDLFIMTSRLEGHPMGLIEALAYGVPCLVSRGTNMYEEVETARCGWVCETEEKSISTAILNMLDESDTLQAKSKAARELASNYRWDKLAKQFHDKIIELKIVK